MLRTLIVIVLFANSALADVKLGLTNESEIGYVVTGGNSESETSSVKQKTYYRWTNHIFKFDGHYLQSSGLVNTPTMNNPDEQSNQVTAENWSAGIRFERVIDPNIFNVFVGYGWYGDRIQGIREGSNADIGAKYFAANKEHYKQYFELGYRYTRELFVEIPSEPVGVGNDIMPEYHFVRLKAAVEYDYSKSFGMGAWIEYLPSVTDLSNDQRINYSPYITSTLTDIFSLKVAYEGRYRFKPALPGNKLTDYTFTTSILAKF